MTPPSNFDLDATIREIIADIMCKMLEKWLQDHPKKHNLRNNQERWLDHYRIIHAMELL